MKLIIFDWDGTLMDSADKIVRAMQMAAEECLLQVPAEDEVKHIIGISLRPAVAQLFGITDQEQTEALAAAYSRHYIALDQQPCALFNGARQVIESLRGQGLLLAVATGKARRGLNRAFQQTGLGELFHASICADESHSKPHPAMLQHLLSAFSVSAEQALMVGDTSHDINMAHAAGIRSVAVTFGAHPLSSLQQSSPTHMIDELHQLLELV